MKVLVTGANGFLGSSLCPYLAALGHEVLPVVRRASGMAHEVVLHDEASWRVALTGCDCVIHLAARAYVMQDHEHDSLQVFRAHNVPPTIELAKRAAAAGVRRYVFMSTVKVHGEETAPGRNFSPDDPAKPKDPYAISKWEAEQGLVEVAKATGLEVVIIRAPLVYGPGVKGNFAALVRLVQKGFPLPLGAIDNRRSMIALDNLLHFTALCADVDGAPNAKDQVFLVSDGQAVSTAELLRRVAQAYGRKSRLFWVPERLLLLVMRWLGQKSFAKRLLGSLVVDDSKARQLLQWHPPVRMNEQLQKMAQHDSLV